jgi:hypothetical protein
MMKTHRVLELDEISQLSISANLSNLDFHAVERLFQVLTGASIGIAKHWVKPIILAVLLQQFYCHLLDFIRRAGEAIIGESS